MKKKRLLEDLIVKPLDMRRCAEQIGLKWSEAIRLYEEGFLSFNPDTTAITTDAMSVEFDFLGRLVVAGCNSKLLKILLRDLEKPYIYELRKHYYDWVKGTWQPIPKLNSLVDFIECQIDVAFDNDDINALNLFSSMAKNIFFTSKTLAIIYIPFIISLVFSTINL